jgi:hypothetical protein
MAVAVATDPQWAPCGQCLCVDGVNPQRDKWEIKGVLKTSRCPRQQTPSDFPYLASLYVHYQNHFLWGAGGISDQPAIYDEVMSLIHQWVNKLRD